MLADRAFLKAFSMLSTEAVFEQHDGETELDVMFRVARLPPETIWQTRVALEQLRGQMNSRCTQILLSWLQGKGLQPDPASGVAQHGVV